MLRFSNLQLVRVSNLEPTQHPDLGTFLGLKIASGSLGGFSLTKRASIQFPVSNYMHGTVIVRAAISVRPWRSHVNCPSANPRTSGPTLTRSTRDSAATCSLRPHPWTTQYFTTGSYRDILKRIVV